MVPTNLVMLIGQGMFVDWEGRLEELFCDVKAEEMELEGRDRGDCLEIVW